MDRVCALLKQIFGAIHEEAICQLGRLCLVRYAIGAITWARIADAIIDLARDRGNDAPVN